MHATARVFHVEGGSLDLSPAYFPTPTDPGRSACLLCNVVYLYSAHLIAKVINLVYLPYETLPDMPSGQSLLLCLDHVRKPRLFSPAAVLPSSCCLLILRSWLLVASLLWKAELLDGSMFGCAVGWNLLESGLGILYLYTKVELASDCRRVLG